MGEENAMEGSKSDCNWLEYLECLISIAESETMEYCKGLRFGGRDLQHLLFSLLYFPDTVCWGSPADPGGMALVLILEQCGSAFSIVWQFKTEELGH